MPFKPDRLITLREAKLLSQEQLGKLAGLSQSVIAKTEKGKNLPGSEALEKLSDALDCTIDYLHGRGPEYDNPATAAAHMAFDVFVRKRVLTDEQREGCRRVLSHPDAPKSAEGWRSLSEMMDLAIGPTSSPGSLALVSKPRTKMTAISRRHRD